MLSQKLYNLSLFLIWLYAEAPLPPPFILFILCPLVFQPRPSPGINPGTLDLSLPLVMLPHTYMAQFHILVQQYDRIWHERIYLFCPTLKGI